MVFTWLLVTEDPFKVSLFKTLDNEIPPENPFTEFPLSSLAFIDKAKGELFLSIVFANLSL